MHYLHPRRIGTCICIHLALRQQNRIRIYRNLSRGAVILRFLLFFHRVVHLHVRSAFSEHVLYVPCKRLLCVRHKIGRVLLFQTDLLQFGVDFGNPVRGFLCGFRILRRKAFAQIVLLSRQGFFRIIQDLLRVEKRVHSRGYISVIRSHVGFRSFSDALLTGRRFKRIGSDTAVIYIDKIICKIRIIRSVFDGIPYSRKRLRVFAHFCGVCIDLFLSEPAKHHGVFRYAVRVIQNPCDSVAYGIHSMCADGFRILIRPG